MPCDIKLQVTYLQNIEGSNGRTFKEEHTGNTTLFKGVPENEKVDLSQVVKYVMSLSKAEREKLASRLRDANTFTLTNRNIKNFNFISNTTPEEMLEAYPELKEEFKDITFPIDENVTIVRCNNMKINNSTYYGRCYDANGNVIFFLKGKYGAQNFFQYYKAKQGIQTGFSEDGKLKDNKYQEQLDLLIEHFKAKNGKELLLDFLDNKGKYKSFKDKEKIIDSVKILNDILSSIAGTNKSNKSGLFMAIENESNKSTSVKNKYIWEVRTKNLYSVLKVYFEDALKEAGIKSVNDFNALSANNLETLLKNLFESDIRLMQARVQSISEEKTKDVQIASKDNIISQQDISTIWQKILKNKNIGRYALVKAIENEPNKVIQYFQEYFKINGYTDNDQVYTDIKISITENKGKKRVSAVYQSLPSNETKYGSRKVKLTFPWSHIGEFHGYAWNSKSIWSPVRKEEGITADFDEDGRYHGVYIYEYYNPKSHATEYAISRHLLSPDSPAYLYTSIEAAKNKIDEWNSKQSIREHSLYVLKQKGDAPRSSVLDFVGIQQGQVITSLNAELPNIKLPSFLQKIFNGTVPQFQEIFKSVERIKELNTPEKAAIFIYKFYDTLKVIYQDKIRAKNFAELDFEYILSDNLDLANDIIEQIGHLTPIHYLVETFIPKTSTGNNLGIIRELPNNGTEINIDKDRTDVIKSPTITDLENAAEYFQKKYGLNITVMSNEDFEKFKEDHPNIKLGNDTRAFVLNDHIYINATNANTSDMFHEVGHIFLGLIKAQDRQVYYKLVENYRQKNLKQFNKVLSSLKEKYSDMSNEDLFEETMVSVMARQSFNKKSMIRGFVGTDFDDEYQFLFEQIQDEFSTIINQDPASPLDFQGLIQELRARGDVMSTMDKNMRIANFVKEMIKNHKIREFDCQ